MRLTAPVSDYAEMMLAEYHDSETLIRTLGDPDRYAHCLDMR